VSLQEIDPLPFAFSFSMIVLGISLVLGFIRLLRGPSLCDRVVAFDLLTTLGVSMIAVYVMMFEKYAELDIAMVVGLVAFLGTVALAYYTEKKRGEL